MAKASRDYPKLTFYHLSYKYVSMVWYHTSKNVRWTFEGALNHYETMGYIVKAKMELLNEKYTVWKLYVCRLALR